MGLRRAAVLLKADDFRDIADLALVAKQPDFEVYQEPKIRRWVGGQRPVGWSLSWFWRPSQSTQGKAKEEMRWVRQSMRSLEHLKKAAEKDRIGRCRDCSDVFLRIVSANIDLSREWFSPPRLGPGHAVQEIIEAAAVGAPLFQNDSRRPWL